MYSNLKSLMELVIYLKNEEDLSVLEPILKRMKLRFEKKNGHTSITKAQNKSVREKNLEEARGILLKMHQEGVDASYFGNPSDWQREMRLETKLPHRD